MDVEVGRSTDFIKNNDKREVVVLGI